MLMRCGGNARQTKNLVSLCFSFDDEVVLYFCKLVMHFHFQKQRKYTSCEKLQNGVKISVIGHFHFQKKKNKTKNILPLTVDGDLALDFCKLVTFGFKSKKPILYMNLIAINC